MTLMPSVSATKLDLMMQYWRLLIRIQSQNLAVHLHQASTSTLCCQAHCRNHRSHHGYLRFPHSKKHASNVLTLNLWDFCHRMAVLRQARMRTVLLEVQEVHDWKGLIPILVQRPVKRMDVILNH